MLRLLCYAGKAAMLRYGAAKPTRKRLDTRAEAGMNTLVTLLIVIVVAGIVIAVLAGDNGVSAWMESLTTRFGELLGTEASP